ncbi:hypothetical protein H257_15759 [Aphanomyces astaci]|uniref:DUF7769 domain-containing protein n=1 Tax=Aphanomyces astaci TaxID=112090 RepID=W4FLF8_APHAT|nr:hypothetical protein H257_15759 [Aphanomyces astaci]ETV68320.1 hypothetical protein H257_15759 [Aphanomyces astaci]|eukprot:XP_009842263.1 hypothetical protein H257_15759 [Aphanomyces astaci]
MPLDQPNHPATPPNTEPRHPDGPNHLRLEDRHGVYETLLSVAQGDVLPRGAITKAAERFRCHRRTISRLWTRARQSLRSGRRDADVATKDCQISLSSVWVTGYDHFAPQEGDTKIACEI